MTAYGVIRQHKKDQKNLSNGTDPDRGNDIVLHYFLRHFFVFSNFCHVPEAYPGNTRCMYTSGQFVLANLSAGKSFKGWWNSHAK